MQTIRYECERECECMRVQLSVFCATFLWLNLNFLGRVFNLLLGQTFIV